MKKSALLRFIPQSPSGGELLLKFIPQLRLFCRRLLLLFLFLFFLTGAAFADDGEGGEEHWIDRYFYHYEYIPYVNGSEFPRTVYRSIGTVGEQNIASTIGQSVFKIDKMKTSENLTGRTNKRDTVAYFDSRTVYRSDVFIFCDFAIRYEKNYIIEHYPYRDHHFHYYYYETPLSIVGFGYEASPEAGSQNLKRIYIDRDMLSAYVAEFSPALLVPASAVFGNDPKGARKKVRQWTEGYATHTSYVWQLDYDQHNYGFWNFFDEDTLSAVTGATEAEKFFRNKEAIEKAQAGLKTRLGETPGQTVPDWTKLALDSKIAISPETLSGYTMPIQEVTRARDVFRMDASNLDKYFPSLREVLLIWQEPGKRMAEDVIAGKKSAEHYYFDGQVIRPVWSGIPYDNALTSGTGSWIHWSPKDDSFTFQIFSDDASVLAHWLYGNATRTFITKTQSNHPGTLSGNGMDRASFNRLIKGFSSLSVIADLSIGSFQRSLYYSLANCESLLISAIEDARVEKAKHVWTDSFVRNNPKSPWSLLKKHFADVYESIVPWTSLSLGLTFLDAGQSTAWKRGIQFELAPTSIFYGTSQETVTAPVKDMKEITGVPAAYEDDGSFTDKKVKEIASGWPVEMSFTNNSYDNTALIRYATARYYPVDLTYRVPLANALSSALGIPVHILSDEKLAAAMNHLLGAPAGAETAGSFGLGKWNKNAEGMFKDAPEGWLAGWGMDNPRNIGFWQNVGKNSFHWNASLETWNYPRITNHK